MAAINCANRLQYLENMQSLPIYTQEVLMNTAQEAGEEPDDSTLPLDADSDEEARNTSRPPSKRESRQSNRDTYEEPPPYAADSGLESEERLGKVIADNQRIAHEKRDLQKQLETLHEHHTKLQQRHDKSADELTETKDRLTSILAGKSGYGVSRSDSSAQSAIISTLETRLTASEEETNTLRKTNEVLRIRAEKTQSLQDSHDELKISHDKLLRKANAAEKYKQKLEASQTLETENSSLKSKVTELQAQLKKSDITHVGHVDLRREIDEYRRLLPAIEQERHELAEMKKRLEFEYHALEARHQDALEQLRRQSSAVEELQGRLQEGDERDVPGTPHKANGRAGPVIESSEDEDEDEEEEDEKEEEGEGEEDPNVPQDRTEDNISETELNAIMAAMREQAIATSDRKLSRLLEKGMRRYEHVVTRAQSQSALIRDLQTKVNDADAKERDAQTQLNVVSRTSAPPPKAALEPDERDALENQLAESEEMVENLRRELRLVTSAWYEMNSRVMQGQMSRGSYAGTGRAASSFLGKARKGVGDVMLGGSSKG